MSIIKTPVKIRNLSIENRIIMPPMATSKSADGKVSDELLDGLRKFYTDTEIIIINMKEVNETSLKILAVFDEAAEEYGNLKITHEEE